MSNELNEAAARYLGERLVFDFPELMREDDAQAVDEIASRPSPSAPLSPDQLDSACERIKAKLQRVWGETVRREASDVSTDENGTTKTEKSSTLAAGTRKSEESGGKVAPNTHTPESRGAESSGRELFLAADTGPSDDDVVVVKGVDGVTFRIRSDPANTEQVVVDVVGFPELQERVKGGEPELFVDGKVLELAEPFDCDGTVVVAKAALSGVREGKATLGIRFV